MDFEKAWHKKALVSTWHLVGASKLFTPHLSPPGHLAAPSTLWSSLRYVSAGQTGAGSFPTVSHSPRCSGWMGSSWTRLFQAEILLPALAGLLPLCSPNLHRHGLTAFPPLLNPPGSPTRQTLLMAPSAGTHPGSSTPSTPLLKGQGPL